MNSVYSDVCLGQRLSLYGVPIRLWHLDWDVRPLALEGISGTIYVAIVWPEQ